MSFLLSLLKKSSFSFLLLERTDLPAKNMNTGKNVFISKTKDGKYEKYVLLYAVNGTRPE
jgi:hypothetical protein